MKRTSRLFLVGAVLSVASALPAPPADVHVRPPNSILAMRRGFTQGRYELRNATMVDLVRTAWGVDADKVVGGPDWLEMDRFDVVTKAPAGSTPEALRQILKEILADRFHLVAHDGTAQVPAYALTVGKKSLLVKSNGTEDSGCKLEPGKTPPSPWGVWGEPVYIQCSGIGMAAFAQALPGLRGASGYLFEYGVLDQTGLQGAWNFNLHWTLRGPGRPPKVPTDQTTLFDALEKQVGLKLEPTRMSKPVVVVESVDRQPTANPPGVAEAFPPPPTQFEVADIKLANPDDGIHGSHVAIQPGGRIRVNMTLKGLVQEAWNALDPERILGMTKVMDETRFDVTAKAPVMALSDGPAVWNGTDIDSMRIMLRNMLVERFHLATHEEDRQVPGYALVGRGAKLRRADPVNRPGCKEGLGAGERDPRIANPMATRLVTCRNMTVGQFAAALRHLAGDYLERYPEVVDATGIEGRYDFSLNFSPRMMLPPVAAPGTAAEGAASDPNGTIPVFDAVERQLGLKLELRKVTATVLVVDHADEMPTAN